MPDKWTGDVVGAMHNNGVTRAELAKELGIAKSYLTMILKGQRKPDGAQERIEAALHEIISRKH